MYIKIALYTSLASEESGIDDGYIWITTQREFWRLFFHQNFYFLAIRMNIKSLLELLLYLQLSILHC